MREACSLFSKNFFCCFFVLFLKLWPKPFITIGMLLFAPIFLFYSLYVHLFLNLKPNNSLTFWCPVGIDASSHTHTPPPYCHNLPIWRQTELARSLYPFPPPFPNPNFFFLISFFFCLPFFLWGGLVCPICFVQKQFSLTFLFFLFKKNKLQNCLIAHSSKFASTSIFTIWSPTGPDDHQKKYFFSCPQQTLILSRVFVRGFVFFFCFQSPDWQTKQILLSKSFFCEFAFFYFDFYWYSLPPPKRKPVSQFTQYSCSIIEAKKRRRGKNPFDHCMIIL